VRRIVVVVLSGAFIIGPSGGRWLTGVRLLRDHRQEHDGALMRCVTSRPSPRFHLQPERILMKRRIPLLATLVAAALPLAAIAQGTAPDARRPAPPQAPAPAKAPTAPSAPTATAGAQEQPKKKAADTKKADTKKKADAKKADAKKAEASKTAKDAPKKATTVQAPGTVSTGPKELRDKDGNVIPTDPSAYPIDSARPRK
jgi:outer membrane biosynthesis protein TonB